MSSKRLVIGLNSGTSADGIDAALVAIEGDGQNLALEVLAHATIPHPPDLKAELRRCPAGSLTQAGVWHRALAEGFAAAARVVAEEGGVALTQVDLIGSHGQTVLHLPAAGVSLQLGDGDLIAERTGITTISDFRARDLAAGGEGAPLSPYLDWVLFQDQPGTCVLNWGGIANATLVQPAFEACRAGDLGPANLPLDTLVGLATDGRQDFDRGGALAAQGSVAGAVLDALIAADDFVARPFPKSTGREVYGAPWVRELQKHLPGASWPDLLATATAFVVETTAAGIEKLAAGSRIDSVLVAGGGARNATLLKGLQERLGPIAVRPFPERPIPSASREAVLFAVLANAAITRTPASLPAATGAAEMRVLGKISSGPRGLPA